VSDVTKAAKWFKREVESLSQYLTKQSELGFPAQHRARLVGYATGALSVGAGEVLLALVHLSNWLGANGCFRVLRGDKDGLAELDLACVYAYWSVRLRIQAYDVRTQPEKQPLSLMDTVSTCWMHASAIGADTVRDWLGERIRRADNGDPSIDGKDMNELCALAAHFVTGKDGAALRKSGWARLGPYESVAMKSLEPEGYMALADYHAKSTDGRGFPAFGAYPYRLAPFELFVVEDCTGVPMGTARHPLLTSPLAECRLSTIDPLPNELKPVIARMSTIFDV
jgi:hypothetical protein